MYSLATREFFRTAAYFTTGVVGFGLLLRATHFESPRSATTLATLLALACSIPLAFGAFRSSPVEAPVHGARLMAVAGTLFGACLSTAIVTRSQAMIVFGMLAVLPHLVFGFTKRVEKHVHPAILIAVGLAQAIGIPMLLGNA